MLKQAEIKAETDAAGAQAAAAGPLAQADRDQAILTEQEKVAIRQAALKDRQLDTEVRKPADAERYRVETEAAARRQAAILEAEAKKAAAIAAAEAEAEKARLTGEGDKSRRAALAEAEAIEGAKRGEAEKARRTAEADAVRAEGEAQASAILATGEAEAEAMNKRGRLRPLQRGGGSGDAGVGSARDRQGDRRPMSSIDKLTVISTDGASDLPKQVNSNLVQVIEMLKNTTGVDIGNLLSKYRARPDAHPPRRRPRRLRRKILRPKRPAQALNARRISVSARSFVTYSQSIYLPGYSAIWLTQSFPQTFAAS